MTGPGLPVAGFEVMLPASKCPPRRWNYRRAWHRTSTSGRRSRIIFRRSLCIFLVSMPPKTMRRKHHE